MVKSKRFQPIHEIVSNSANDLSRAMADAAKKVSDLEKQLEQLTSYREEYLKNSAQANASMDAVKMQNFRSFLERLGAAMAQHHKTLDSARKEYEKRRLAWSEKRIEAESLSKVMDRFRQEERSVADRREQREIDDAALRLSADRRNSGNL